MSFIFKTRQPSIDLYHNDYLRWLADVISWLDKVVAAPNYPAHLAADLPTLYAAFDAALASYNDLKGEVVSKGDVYGPPAKATAVILQRLKDLLPTTINDPGAMGAFGLNEPVPEDRDDVYQMAQTCVDEWNDLTSTAVPPEYAPLEADFTELVNTFADFKAKRDDLHSTVQDSQIAQNDVLETRDSCHELERKIFNWYRAYHKKATDEWWTETPWGASSGGDKPPAPSPVEWDETTGTLSWGEVSGAGLYQAEVRLVGASGDWTRIYEGAELFTTNAPDVPGEYNARVRAIVDGETGNFSGSIVVNFPDGTASPAVPTLPRFVNDYAAHFWHWMVDTVPDAVEYEFETMLEGGSWQQLYRGPKNSCAAELIEGKVYMRCRCFNSASVPSDWTADISFSFYEMAPFALTQHVISHVSGDPNYHIDFAYAACSGALYYDFLAYDPLGGDPYEDMTTELTWVKDTTLFGDDSLTELECAVIAHDGGTGWSRVSVTVTVEIT